MFRNTQFSTRYTTSSGLFGAAGWLFITPGVLLMLMALAILIWPDLLAYMVATVLLFVGTWLTVWGWTLRRAQRADRSRHGADQTIRYTIQ